MQSAALKHAVAPSWCSESVLPPQPLLAAALLLLLLVLLQQQLCDAPVGPYRLLPANVPHIQLETITHQRLDVEALRVHAAHGIRVCCNYVSVLHARQQHVRHALSSALLQRNAQHSALNCLVGSKVPLQQSDHSQQHPLLSVSRRTPACASDVLLANLVHCSTQCATNVPHVGSCWLGCCLPAWA